MTDMAAVIEAQGAAGMHGTAVPSRDYETLADPPSLGAVIRLATEALLREQRADGHWVFELEADATIPSEYVLLTHWLGEDTNPALERKIATYLRRRQGA